MAVKILSLPDLGEGVTEGEILKIKVKAGDFIARDQALVEVMTDKASMEVPSFIEGLVESVEVCEGDMVSVGSPLFKVQTDDKDSPTKEERKQETEPIKTKASLKEERGTEKSPQDSSIAIPYTRKLAQDLGLDLKEIAQQRGSQKVRREDLLDYIKAQMAKGSKDTLYNSPESSGSKEPDFAIEKRQALRGVPRLMFDSMTLSKATIPHFTICEELWADYLIPLRTEMKNRLQNQGLKVGYLPFFVKALIPVIQEFPLFNAVYDHASKEILFKKNIHVGFAVDSPQGLLVPVIKNLQSKSLLEIIKEVYSLSVQCRKSEIAREDLQGAGISITNLGSLGGISGTPIIQPPQMAILGIYKIRPQLVKNEKGQVEQKQALTLSLTCDHRFIDGATALRFLKSLCQKIQEPSLLLL